MLDHESLAMNNCDATLRSSGRRGFPRWRATPEDTPMGRYPELYCLSLRTLRIHLVLRMTNETLTKIMILVLITVSRLKSNRFPVVAIFMIRYSRW